jgi:hypothetical protein
MADQQLIAEMHDLMDEAEPFRARNYFNTARDLMREAQGIPRVWHEVAVDEI